MSVTNTTQTTENPTVVLAHVTEEKEKEKEEIFPKPQESQGNPDANELEIVAQDSHVVPLERWGDVPTDNNDDEQEADRQEKQGNEQGGVFLHHYFFCFSRNRKRFIFPSDCHQCG